MAAALKLRSERLVRRFGSFRERNAWAEVLTRASRNFLRHDMTVHSGNFAYSSFLAVFPLVLLITSIVGFIFSYSPDTMQKLIDILREALPDMPVTINNAVDSLVRFRGVVGALGLIGLVWSVSRIAYAVQTGFDQVWEMKKRSYVRKKVFAMGVIMLIGAVGIAGLGISMVLTGFLSWLNEVTGPVFSLVAVVLGVLVSPVASLLIFATIYRTLPQEKPAWRDILWGALAAALLLDASEYLLGFYFTRVSRTQAVYGSVGIVIGVVLWLYVVGILIFLGAEIVKAVQERRAVAVE